jgi:hypothetical protein
VKRAVRLLLGESDATGREQGVLSHHPAHAARARVNSGNADAYLVDHIRREIEASGEATRPFSRRGPEGLTLSVRANLVVINRRLIFRRI